jgi:putative NADH-flavin reductase
VKIAVVGSTGMGGQLIVDQLVARGHDVSGIAIDADPAKDRAGLRNVRGDIFNVPQMTGLLAGHDVVISAFSGGHEVSDRVYYLQAEGTRRLIDAFRKARGQYLLYIGGAASLYVKPGLQMNDDPRFPKWYFATHPPAHLRWLGDITGVGFFYEAADRRARGEIPAGESDAILEADLAGWEHVPLLEGCRIALDLFEGRTDFRWSFLSPPWRYRPGRATGAYNTSVDFMIFENGLPTGISVPDLALAVVDEAEAQALVHRHWTVSGAQEND